MTSNMSLIYKGLLPMVRPARCAALAGILMAVMASTALATPNLSATGSAWLAEEPEYQGYWKYCYDVSWGNLPHGVSHLDLLLCMLADCPCVCTPGYFAFEDTVGSGPGTYLERPCTVYYYGLFECYGDPSISIDDPLIKFEPYEGDCEPDGMGTAHVCFYSVAAPVYGTWVDYVVIKFAGLSAFGTLEGPLPGCEYGASGSDESTWGKIKTLYR